MTAGAHLSKHTLVKPATPVCRSRLCQCCSTGPGCVTPPAYWVSIAIQLVPPLKKSQQVLRVHPAYSHKSLRLILKVDESWSFVQAKKHPRWLWWVEDAVNGQVVAFVFGRRTHQTFRRLLSLLELAQITVSKWITDAWWAYFDCLDPGSRIESKALLQSLERKHLTLRTRIKRLARKTICFSKSVLVHDTIIGLFINQFFLWYSTLLSHYL